jgi:hypothetical protein
MSPAAGAYVVVEFVRVATQIDKKSDGLSTDLVDAEVGHVRYGYPPRRGSLEVDHVDPDSVTRNHLALLQRIDHVFAYLRELHEYCISVRREYRQVTVSSRLCADQADVKSRPVEDVGLDRLMRVREIREDNTKRRHG